MPAGIYSRPSLKERFMDNVIIKANGCWEWQGTIMSNGYGRVHLKTGQLSAHRAAYQLFVGVIPDGLSIDHLCHNSDAACQGGKSCQHRRCVNPSHLEATTTQNNVLRGVGLCANNAKKTHCPKGHPYNDANTRIAIDKISKHRECRECARLRFKKGAGAKAGI